MRSVGAGANDRHSAYSLRFATIAYPWHPLMGRTFQVSPHRRGKDRKCIYTDERPDLCRELPNWMFDASYCVGMRLGPPEVSIEGLNQLAAVLAELGKTRDQDPRSRFSKKKEKGHAPELPVERETKGLVETLADLLLEALGAVGTPQTGGTDEH